jgi:hypothetical protein
MFLSVPQGKYYISTFVRHWPLPYTLFYISYSLIIIPSLYIAIILWMLRALLNSSQKRRALVLPFWFLQPGDVGS